MANTRRQQRKRKRQQERDRKHAAGRQSDVELPDVEIADTTEQSGDSKDKKTGRLRSVIDRLDTVAKRVAAIAGVVVAIAGAVTAVRGLLPKDSDPVNLQATLHPIDLRVGVALDEFAAHETFITASSGDSGDVAVAVPVLRARALLFAQSSSDGETAQSAGERGDPPASSAGAGGETSTDPGGETTIPGETTPGEDPPGQTTTPGEDPGQDPAGTEPAADEPVVPPRREARCAQETTEPGEAPPNSGEPLEPPPDPACGGLVRPADRRRSPVQLEREREQVVAEIEQGYVLGEACEAEPTSAACPITSGVSSTPLMQTLQGGPGEPEEPEGPGGDDPQESRREVESEKLALARAGLRQLRNTRFERGPDGRKRPLGIVVDYRLTLCGFTDQRARVFWSMFDTGRPPKLPYLWVHHRLANVIRQRSTNCEDVAPRFWVPLPAVDGRFTIELSVVDEDGTTRFRRRTEPFEP